MLSDGGSSEVLWVDGRRQRKSIDHRGIAGLLLLLIHLVLASAQSSLAKDMRRKALLKLGLGVLRKGLAEKAVGCIGSPSLSTHVI